MTKSSKNHTSRQNIVIKYLLLIVFFAVSISTMGQVYKLRSTAFSSKYKINEYSWSEWSEWEKTSLLIVINMNDERFTIYSQKTQVYDIIEYDGESTNNDGDRTFSYLCANKDGLRCEVRLVRRDSMNGELQLYVDFNDMSWAYAVYSVD